MRRVLLISCMTALIFTSCPGWADDVNSINTAAEATAKANQQVELAQATAKNASEATPVTAKAEDGLDYSAGAGDSAAKADMALSVAGVFADRLVRNIVQWIGSETVSNIISAPSPIPLLDEMSWFNIFISWNLVDTGMTLGHAAINKFMRDATYITGTFTGTQGHVTDKWGGPPNRNKTIAIMGDVAVTSEKFDALTFNPAEYQGMTEDEAKKASASKLQDYRAKTLIENQRSLKNVTGENWNILYRAQQRSIKALTGALELKGQLAALADVDKKIDAEYDSKPQALNTLASRRALHDALLLLKLNVLAARTRLRSEMLELDFKPKTKENETE